jgi:hypothetical protein
MRHRFVPSYYARDLLNKMQRFQQGSQSVEEYYQELQKGMLRCDLVESDDAAMACFRGGLNREIPTQLIIRLTLHRAQGRPSQRRPPAKGVVSSTGRTRDIQCHRCIGFGT